jgi:hypothetical protein
MPMPSRPGHVKTELESATGPDLTLVLLAVVGLTMVFMVTFELWLSH